MKVSPVATHRSFLTLGTEASAHCRFFVSFVVLFSTVLCLLPSGIVRFSFAFGKVSKLLSSPRTVQVKCKYINALVYLCISTRLFTVRRILPSMLLEKRVTKCLNMARYLAAMRGKISQLPRVVYPLGIKRQALKQIYTLGLIQKRRFAPGFVKFQ